MDYINDIITRLSSIISTITFLDAIDILLLTFFIYKGIKLIRETKAQQLLTGILVVIAVYFISAGLELRVMSYLLSNFLQVGIIAILIVFQPELRRMLEKVGRTNVKSIGVFSDSVRSDDMIQNWNRTIEVVGEAASQLSESTTGALIVIERQTRLGEQIDTGTVMDCVPSVASLGTIFFPKTPLHDGAVIIRNARIIAAGCFLPTPQKEERINKLLGSRHRAAIGMSENSDAIIVVVSEETGTISIAENGELTRGYTKDRLIKYLKSQIIPEKPLAEEGRFSRLLPRKEKKNATEEKEA